MVPESTREYRDSPTTDETTRLPAGSILTFNCFIASLKQTDYKGLTIRALLKLSFILTFEFRALGRQRESTPVGYQHL